MLTDAAAQEFRGGSPGERLGDRWIAGTDAKGVGPGRDGLAGLCEVVRGATDERGWSEQVAGGRDGHVLGTDVDTVDPRGRSHRDAVVDGNQRGSGGVRPPGQERGPFGSIQEQGIGGGFVPDLKHPHAGCEQGRHQPLEGGRVDLGIEQDTEPNRGQSQPETGGMVRGSHRGGSAGMNIVNHRNFPSTMVPHGRRNLLACRGRIPILPTRVRPGRPPGVVLMAPARYLTLVWPGLPWLWLRGSFAGLVLAVAFAITLDVAVITTLIWSELVEISFALTVWTITAILWLVSMVSALASFPPPLRRPAPAEVDPLFVRARSAYLARDWVVAETRLRELLSLAPTDGEAQLLLATLLRRTGRRDEARRALEKLSQSDSGTRWSRAITAELSQLEGTGARTSDAETGPATLPLADRGDGVGSDPAGRAEAA
jgi:hypothetical protein